MLIFGLWKSTVSFINFKTFRDYLVKCSVDSLGRVGWMGYPGMTAHWACVLGIISQFSEVKAELQTCRFPHILGFPSTIIHLVGFVVSCWGSLVLNSLLPISKIMRKALAGLSKHTSRWLMLKSIFTEREWSHKDEDVYIEKILRAENPSNSKNSVWPDIYTD